MLIALGQFNREELLGALLLFRLLYYILPFAISLAIVAFRELVLDIKPLIAREGSGRARRKSRNGSARKPEPSPRRRPRRRSPSAAI
jgi:hypothetical protein